MSVDRVSEQCSCGASIELVAFSVDSKLAKWREGHRHEPQGQPAEQLREVDMGSMAEQSEPVTRPEMQIGFSRNWEEFGGRA